MRRGTDCWDAFNCTLKRAQMSLTESGQIPIYNKSWINLSNSNIIYPCVVFFFIWIVAINSFIVVGNLSTPYTGLPRSMPNVDQFRSMPINSSQCRLIGNDRHWEALIGIGHWLGESCIHMSCKSDGVAPSMSSALRRQPESFELFRTMFRIGTLFRGPVYFMHCFGRYNGNNSKWPWYGG